MSSIKDSFEIIDPLNQKNLYGYSNLFNVFVNLFNKNKLPSSILLSGPKGSGKATFTYHFINFLLSRDEKDSYSLDNYSINSNNKSFINTINGTHPNFFLLDSNLLNENIKIDSVRNLLIFLRKSTFRSNLKIVLIDNAEYLNASSSNALLKAIEEPATNTFFFIIQNSSRKILDTIKSRCVEFKFFLSQEQKKSIVNNLVSQFNFNFTNIDKNLFASYPGTILKFLNILNEVGLTSIDDKPLCISKVVDIYKKKKTPDKINFISYLVELFYYELSIKNSNLVTLYSENRNKILTYLNDLRKFHLDTNNSFIEIENIIFNESK